MKKGSAGIRILVVIELLCARLVSGRDIIFGSWTAQTLKTSQEKSFGRSGALQSQPQRNALLPSGSVYFLNINSGDRFKACLEIKHIIM